MIFQLLLACCFFYLGHSDYAAKVSNEVLPMKYECNATDHISLKKSLFHIAVPHEMVDPALRIMFNNMNRTSVTENDLIQLTVRHFKYCNQLDCRKPTGIYDLETKPYIPPPVMTEELDNYTYSYGSPYISTHKLGSQLLHFTAPGLNVYKVHALLADKAPFLRTINYCTGTRFFSCITVRSKFYYEGELQLDLQSNFKYNAFIVIAADKAYYAWLYTMRRMQIRAGAVLRVNSISDNPMAHLLNVSKQLSCISYDRVTQWANSVLYDMSIRFSFPFPVLPLVHKGTIVPYFIFTVPWEINREVKAKADGLFVNKYLADLVGLMMSRYPYVKVDFISLDPMNVNNKRIEIYDTMNRNIIPKNMLNQVSSHYRKSLILKETAITELDKYIPFITQQILETMDRHPQNIFVPIVTSFVCQYPFLSATNYIEKVLRQLDNFQGHSILITNSAKYTERFTPIEMTNLYYSKLHTFSFDTHTTTEVFRIAEMHLQEVSKDLQRTNELITDMTKPSNAVLPISSLTNQKIEMLIAVPSAVYTSNYQVAIKNFLANNFVITRNYLQQIFRPIIMATAAAIYPVAQESVNLSNCEIVQDLTYTAFENEVSTKIGQHSCRGSCYKTIEFNNCIKKVPWNSGSYKVAIVFVNEYNLSWLEYLTERFGDFAQKGLRKNGILIIVSDRMKDVQGVPKGKDIYLIQANLCSNLKKCVAGVIWNSHLANSKNKNNKLLNNAN